MRKSLIALSLGALLLLQISFTHSQGVQQKTVITTGDGKTEKDAIKDALVAAVSQVRGIAVSSRDSVAIRSQIHNESSSSSRDFQQNVQTYTNGVVSQYEVLETGHSTLTGNITVKIRATIPFYAAGPQINRLRLAVVPLTLSDSIRDRASASQFAHSWMSATEEGLVQSRRFAMLDRSFTEATNNELSQYTNGQFSNSELARLGQKAGTDYLVTGELRTYAINDKSFINPLTGDRVPRSSTSTEVSLRIIDVATSQVKFAKSYGDSKAAVIDVIDAIYPMAIVSVSDGAVVIGAGGDQIKVGDKFRVISLGQELKDPYTNESLGRQETAIGEIEITDVESKMSQARITSGNDLINQRFPSGLIVRSMPKPVAKTAAPKPKKRDDSEW
jgi:hypothetical protein